MSHYCEVKLEMNGDAKAVRRALANLFGVALEKIIESNAPLPLYGYVGDVREQTAHLIVPGRSRPGHAQIVKGASNDIGLYRGADGKWVAHISENEVRCGFDGEWQKRLLSRWAIERVGLEAESRGRSWEVKYGEESGKKFAYVHVSQPF